GHGGGGAPAGARRVSRRLRAACARRTRHPAILTARTRSELSAVVCEGRRVGGARREGDAAGAVSGREGRSGHRTLSSGGGTDLEYYRTKLSHGKGRAARPRAASPLPKITRSPAPARSAPPPDIPASPGGS